MDRWDDEDLDLEPIIFKINVLHVCIYACVYGQPDTYSVYVHV